jgi:hypothetical protein
MATIFIILLIAIFVIAVDFAWSTWVEKTRAYRFLRDSLARSRGSICAASSVSDNPFTFASFLVVPIVPAI